MRESSELNDDADKLGEAFGAIAMEAGAAILDARRRGTVARLKPDASPVTDADERAEDIVLRRLACLLPAVPVVAEESVARGSTPEIGREFILVDPLDGTREFIAGRDDFTVNIALVRQGAPVAAAVYAPARDQLWYSGRHAYASNSAARGRGAARVIRSRPAPENGLVALISRVHLDAGAVDILARLPVAERLPMGSSLKFCVIAEGGADIYPRFGPTMEWDTAAGDAILRAAGGVCLGEGGEPLTYGEATSGFRNGGFLAWGDPDAARRFAGELQTRTLLQK